MSIPAIHIYHLAQVGIEPRGAADRTVPLGAADAVGDLLGAANQVAVFPDPALENARSIIVSGTDDDAGSADERYEGAEEEKEEVGFHGCG